MTLRSYRYVVATKNIGDIHSRAVGLVQNDDGKRLTVLFIGAAKTVETNQNNVEYFDIEKTGKPYKYKICNVCHLLKEDFKEFDINQTDSKGRKTTRPSCTECRIFIDGEPMITAESKRLDKLLPNGIFTCPICLKKSIANKTANLVKDHDHRTGKGREWICDSCNTGLGRFGDNIGLLQRAINYLKKHGAQ